MMTSKNFIDGDVTLRNSVGCWLMENTWLWDEAL